MSDERRTSSERRVSSVDISADEVEISDPHEFGKAIFACLYRLLRIGSIYAPDNELTEDAIAMFMELFDEAMSRRSDDGIDIEIRGEFVTINEETPRLGPDARERLREVREIFVDVGLYRIHVQRGLAAHDLSRLVGHLRRVIESEHVEDMEAVEVPHIRLYSGRPTRSIRRAFGEVGLTHYQSHLYSRFLVIVRNVARQHQKQGELAVPTDRLRRITRRIAVLFGAGSRQLLGWLPDGLMRSTGTIQTVHSAIHAIFLAERLGLSPATAGELGAGIVWEDFQWLERPSTPDRRPSDGSVDSTARRQNIEALMARTGRASASTAMAFCQQLLFERGMPLAPAPDEQSISLASKIADVARTYTADLHGHAQSDSFGPVEALDRLASRTGAVLDAAVAEAFDEAMGDYPPGTRVELSAGDRALVLAPPSAGAPPDRPTVALESSPDTPIDLYDQTETSLSIRGIWTGEATGDGVPTWTDELYLFD